MEYQKALDNLIGSFKKLPGVGLKSAERMALYVLEMEEDEVGEFIKALKDVRKDVSKCPICGILKGTGACPICDDKNRDSTTIAVVQNIKDVYTLERSREYKGLYHILNGLIAINQGANLNNLSFNSLVERVKNGGVKEVIIATNPTMEGETTGLYIKKLLEQYSDVLISRLAYGLPYGGHIDYADDMTITRAFEGRRKIN